MGVIDSNKPDETWLRPDDPTALQQVSLLVINVLVLHAQCGEVVVSRFHP